jgi:hypothetical protein
MHTLSVVQALDLWSDLERAYHSTNSYGGDEAELYLYRLMPYTPTVNKIELIDKPGIFGDIVREAYDAANQALYNLLNHFSKKREAVITVEGQPLGPWLITARYVHRVHVKVTPK